MQTSAKARSGRPTVDSRKRVAVAAMLVLWLFGCAAEEEKEDKRPPGGKGRASVEELRVYVDEVKPESVRTVRFKEPLRWTYLNDYFVFMETRNGPHLVEMAVECKELRAFQYNIDMADQRDIRGVLRVHDTIRRCKIANFYKLPAANAVEAVDDGEPK